ncbi:MAG TPA: YdcF family protein [Kiloniellales bacterium]
MVGLAVAAWLAGLVWFTAQLPTTVNDPTRATDAIVVLTGGSGRVLEGIELLAAGRARKLLISGVNPGVDMEGLLRFSQRSPAELECCVTLGYQASSTFGNAIETARWMGENDLHSLRLVTAAYHMPRSLLQFRRAMPEIEIIPHPVFSEHFRQDDWWRWPGSATLIVSEYSKYLVALALDRRASRPR